MDSKVTNSTYVQRLIDRLQAGDDSARKELIEHSMDRFRALASRMLPKNSDLRALEDSGDVLQKAMMKLYNALSTIKPPNVPALHGLAATQIRWVLLDLARELKKEKFARFQPLPEEGVPENQEPRTVIQWEAWHEAIQNLPDEEREIVDHMFYQGLSQDEAAEALQTSVRTVKRRWQRAKIILHKRLGGEPQ